MFILLPLLSIISFVSLYYLLPKSIVIKTINYYYPQIITNTNSDKICITIDDVPYTNSNLFTTLELFNKYNIKVMLFVITTDTNNELLIDAIKQGHLLCNHGVTDSMHSKKTLEELRIEIVKCDDFINRIYDKAKITRPTQRFYRPGCGFFHQKMIDLCTNLGYTLVLGSVYPHDPQCKSTFINFHYVKSKLDKGDILILHDRYYTPDLLTKLLPYIQSQKLETCVLK
jgi:peptidoglycan/xylan/chitin deacetylase (PgdA/CDA1 family)